MDLLMTTNNGPAVLLRNDQKAGNRSLRFRLTGTRSNRDAIGATVRIFHDGASQTRMVKSGSSYLSQSELPVTFGVGQRDRVDRAVVSRGRAGASKSSRTSRPAGATSAWKARGSHLLHSAAQVTSQNSEFQSSCSSTDGSNFGTRRWRVACSKA